MPSGEASLAMKSKLNAEAKEFTLPHLNADAVEFTPGDKNSRTKMDEEMENLALLEELFLENTIERELNAVTFWMS